MILTRPKDWNTYRTWAVDDRKKRPASEIGTGDKLRAGSAGT
ncbi:MAG TPA: hypothetical protein VMB49_07060 [Acidobacteriaceae bacterium]|nr:hypothetical protein [Acidobacteriaceae bacterium]